MDDQEMMKKALIYSTDSGNSNDMIPYCCGYRDGYKDNDWNTSNKLPKEGDKIIVYYEEDGEEISYVLKYNELRHWGNLPKNLLWKYAPKIKK